jgi:hypothetical protein
MVVQWIRLDESGLVERLDEYEKYAFEDGNGNKGAEYLTRVSRGVWLQVGTLPGSCPWFVLGSTSQGLLISRLL